MRRLNPLLLLLLLSCAKSPEGFFVSEAGGARIYKEGDGLFLELFAFSQSRTKPQLLTRLERREGGWTVPAALLRDPIPLTFTDTGLLLTLGGTLNVPFARVRPASAQQLERSRADEALRVSLRSLMESLDKTKRCDDPGLHFGPHDSSRTEAQVATTKALVDAATPVSDAIEANPQAQGPWFDEFLVSGQVELSAVSLATQMSKACVKWSLDLFGGRQCARLGEANVKASTHGAKLPFRARIALARYPEQVHSPIVTWTDLEGSDKDTGTATVCRLVDRKALAYAEEVTPR